MNKFAASFQNELLQFKRMLLQIKKGEAGIRIFIFLSGKVLYFFLGLCVPIRTNFRKCFAGRAVGNALQPQISLIKNAPQEFKTSATAVTCAHNQWWRSKKERNISARAVTCAQKQWQKHYTNLKHLLQQSIARKINIEILKEKCKKSQCISSNLRSIHFLDGAVGRRNPYEHGCKISQPSLYIFCQKMWPSPGKQ